MLDPDRRAWECKMSKGLLRSISFFLAAAFSAAAGATTSISVGDASFAEGPNSAIHGQALPITVTGDSGDDIALTYRTESAASSPASAGVDYVAVPAGGRGLHTTGHTDGVVVQVIGDNIDEPDENFVVRLTGANNVGPQLAFGVTAGFTAGANSYAVAVGDVNHDGKPDVAVANFSDNNVTVLLNTSTIGAASPTFAPPANFATGNGPSGVAFADIDGDGRLDLVVTCLSSNVADVLINATAAGAASPSFGVAAGLPTGSAPRAVAIADFNGDGRPDIATANQAANNVSVMLNQTAPGGGLAFTATTFVVGDTPLAIAVGDVNGDGRADIAVADYVDGSAAVLVNNMGPGAITPLFAPAVSFAATGNCSGIAIGDLNADGKADLAVSNASANTVSLLLNTTGGGGPPTFAAAVSQDALTAPLGVTMGDLNGDGRADIVVAGSGSGALAVLRSTSAPGATALDRTQSFNSPAAGSLPRAVAIGDFNGDGNPDLAVANGSGNVVSVVMNTTPHAVHPASLRAPVAFPGPAVGRLMAIADFNRDGRLDAAAATNTGTVDVFLNTTLPNAGTPSFATVEPFNATVVSSTLSAIAADFNGDGRPDLAVGDAEGAVSVLISITGTGATAANFAAAVKFGVGSFPRGLAVADFNADGKPDIATANTSSANVSVLLNTTLPGDLSATFAAAVTLATASSNPASIAAVDLNSDGRPDLATADGGGTISMMLNTMAPGATIAAFGPTTSLLGSTPLSLSFADFNGDGRPDIVHGDGPTVHMNITAPGAAFPVFNSGVAFSCNGIAAAAPTLATADMDGDGRADIVSTDDDMIGIIRNTTVPGATPGTCANGEEFTTGVTPSGLALADINNDGMADVLTNDGNNLIVMLNRVRAVAITGARATATILDDDAPVPAPTGVTATPGSTTVTLHWNAAAGAASYRVYQGTTPGGESATSVFATSSTAAVIKGLTNGTPYYFTVKSFSGAVVGPASAEVHATPMAAPTGVTATPSADGKITLRWNAAPGAASYRVYQGTASGAEGSTSVWATSSLFATIPNLTDGTTYWFIVKSFNGGVGPVSAEVHATAMAPPTNLVATPGSGSITLHWTAAAGAASYRVYQGTASGAEGAASVWATSSTQATISGLANGTTYWFVVKSFNAGIGPASAEISSTPAP
jgi:hypothetical protein